jgi:hypothetical protein
LRKISIAAAAVALSLSAPSWAEPPRFAAPDAKRASAPAANGGYVGYAYTPAPGLPGSAAQPVTFGQPVEPPPPDSANGAPREKSGFALDIGAATELPISLGGVVAAEVPGRILFQVGLGVMPKGYVNLLDTFLTSVGAYNQAVSGVVRGSLGNSFVLKASAGWRPFSGLGLELLGGYTLMTLGGSVAASDAINAVLGETGSPFRVPAGAAPDIPLAATLHNVHATIGWRWLLAEDHLVIRASLSYIQTVAATMNVSLANVPVVAAYEGQVNTAINDAIRPLFKTYAKAPTLGLSAAYRF